MQDESTLYKHSSYVLMQRPKQQVPNSYKLFYAHLLFYLTTLSMIIIFVYVSRNIERYMLQKIALPSILHQSNRSVARKDILGKAQTTHLDISYNSVKNSFSKDVQSLYFQWKNQSTKLEAPQMYHYERASRRLWDVHLERRPGALGNIMF